MAVALLRGWNGQVTVDSAAASVFALWLAEMARRIAQAKAPASWRYALGYGFGEIVPLTTFHSGSVAQTRSACASSRTAGSRAAGLSRRPMRWRRPCDGCGPSTAPIRRMGVGPPTDVDPAPSRRRPGATADAFNLGPVPMPGDGTTPLQAASGPLDFGNPGFVPNTRAVIDLADPEAGRWVLAGGQSGNPDVAELPGPVRPLDARRGGPHPGRKRRSRRPRSRRCSSSRPASPLRRRAAAFAALILPVAEHVVGLHQGVDLAVPS